MNIRNGMGVGAALDFCHPGEHSGAGPEPRSVGAEVCRVTSAGCRDGCRGGRDERVRLEIGKSGTSTLGFHRWRTARTNFRFRTSFLTIATVSLLFLFCPDAFGQNLEKRVEILERQVDSMATVGLVLFLYGTVCALWAQRAKRSAWGWFFLGLFFGPLAAIGMLMVNSRDVNSDR